MVNQLKTWIVLIAVFVIGFTAVSDTIYMVLKKQPVEISSSISEAETSKTEKEKEKEKEIDEADEFYFIDMFLSLSRPVLLLNTTQKFSGSEDFLPDYVSEIIPPPPKA